METTLEQRESRSARQACVADGPPWSARTEKVCSQGILLLLLLLLLPLSTAVNKHLLDNKLTCWLLKTGQFYACFYDKELDYGSYIICITELRILIPGGRRPRGWLKRYGVYCLRVEWRGDAKERRVNSVVEEIQYEARRESVIVKKTTTYKPTYIDRFQAMI